MPTSKPVPDESSGKKTGEKDEIFRMYERSLGGDSQVEVSLKDKYDP